MTTTAFDTLEMSHLLQERAGFTPQQAEGTVIAFASAMKDSVATKGDVEALRKDLKADIESLRKDLKADIESLRKDLKADIAVLRGEMTLLKWMTGFIAVGVVSLVVATVSLVFKAFLV